MIKLWFNQIRKEDFNKCKSQHGTVIGYWLMRITLSNKLEKQKAPVGDFLLCDFWFPLPPPTPLKMYKYQIFPLEFHLYNSACIV